MFLKAIWTLSNFRDYLTLVKVDLKVYVYWLWKILRQGDFELQNFDGEGGPAALKVVERELQAYGSQFQSLAVTYLCLFDKTFKNNAVIPDTAIRKQKNSGHRKKESRTTIFNLS